MLPEHAIERLARQARELGVTQSNDVRRSWPSGDDPHLPDRPAGNDPSHRLGPGPIRPEHTQTTAQHDVKRIRPLAGAKQGRATRQ